MRISVIGCGYLGAVHAACMAELGHEVVGVDVDENKIAQLSAGRAPFFEPGLPEVLDRAIASGRLRFTTDIAEAAGASVHFVAVGTPQVVGSDAADLRFVDASFSALAAHLAPGDLVVGKSTVPVGTAARLSELVEATGASLAWNPEFLREGFAVGDTLSPDRLVYGVRAGDDAAVAALDEVYSAALAAGTPRLVTDYATAELVKVAANAFLATKISFINAMAEVAEATGADVTQLADAIGHDARIGRRFLNSGLGFGGGCLPKDIRAFMARGDELGVGESLAFLREVDAINLRRRTRVVDLVAAALDGDVAGRRIAALGLAFKPDSDDVRDSPALEVVQRLTELGAAVVATDPEAIETARRSKPDVHYAPTVEEAVDGAECIVVLTEWREYREFTPESLGRITTARRIVDARNCLDPKQWRDAGWTYSAPGRP
ncbi:UDP-glucose dehydrogenase family protein [Salinibacterium soli]|uniref:UDP-glucose 6-dehydrogenase n=1 Tax=Antiquaquibacter soli TaxID=3064523 RepID=A0ABT9BJ95_9MICO|nr:UDP-glucose/GDP-mannose dehydrogenase family protein [Protaetiibacter sp. WY-16]MDO7881103.1 UDP-glucose/GDP-mannose dehydrogenase family protein [Protaetiibacter sp. WY-16]